MLKTNPTAAPGGSSPATSAASGGASLFADLVSVLTGGAVTVNAATAAEPSHSPVPQDIQAFRQSLMQALSAGNGTSRATGVAQPRGYAPGHDGMRGKLEYLIDALGGNGNRSALHGSAGASTGAAVANLKAAYGKLIADFGATGSSPANSSVTLRGLLHSMLQQLQQQGSWAASAGHVVHAVA